MSMYAEIWRRWPTMTEMQRQRALDMVEAEVVRMCLEDRMAAEFLSAMEE